MTVAPSDKSPGEETSSPGDTGLTCLLLLARILEVPAREDTLLRQAGLEGQPFTETDLLRAAKSLEIKARAVDSRWSRLAATPLPAMARTRDGSGWFLIAKIAPDQSRVLLHDPIEGKAVEATREELEDRWDGRLILMTTRAQLAGEARAFDISWFIPAVIKYRRLFGEVLAASFFLQTFSLVTPLFFQVVIDKVLVHRGLTSLDVLVIGLVLISLFESVLGALRTYIFSHTTNRVDVELGASVYRHLTRLPIAYFAARRVGETVARVRELESVRSFLTGSALTLVIDLAFTVIFLSVMFSYAPLLTWIVVGSFPFYITLSVLVTPTLRARVEEKFRRGAENQAFLVETMSGVETVKSLAVEPQLQRRWEEQLAGYVGISFKAAQIGNIAGQGVQFIQKACMAATLWYGARLVIDGDLTVGQLVAFNMLSGRVSQPILRLAQLWQDFQQMRVSIARLGDILNTRPETQGAAGKGSLSELKGALTFDRAIFRYQPQGKEILRGLDLEIRAGETLGVCGPSGSGKSTLAKLVQRLHVPESGRVLLDGTDLTMVDPAWLRRQIGVVPQESFLFTRSVRDNIAITHPAAPLEAVVEAAKLAGAHDFILELEEGYDTRIEERGSSLSGGQRQRIAIARALMGDPRILIFDEATSALDYESEQAIQANMRAITKGRTVIVIAHRLSTLRDCHRIAVIEKGRVEELGAHDELLRLKGRYATLWAAQSKAPAPVAAPVAAPVSTPVPTPARAPETPTQQLAVAAKPQPRAKSTGTPGQTVSFQRGEDGRLILGTSHLPKQSAQS